MSAFTAFKRIAKQRLGTHKSTGALPWTVLPEANPEEHVEYTSEGSTAALNRLKLNSAFRWQGYLRKLYIQTG
jgi:hypothetical protein